jgi:hypothetical protein
MKISAMESLLNELVSRGCERTKATFLVEEFKREMSEKKRRRSFLNFGKSREPSAREVQNANIAAFRAELDAIYGQDQSQNCGTLAAPIDLLLSPSPASGNPKRVITGPNPDTLPISRKHIEGDLLASDGDGYQF